MTIELDTVFVLDISDEVLELTAGSAQGGAPNPKSWMSPLGAC